MIVPIIPLGIGIKLKKSSAIKANKKSPKTSSKIPNVFTPCHNNHSYIAYLLQNNLTNN
jgi:hypothetical protein